MKHSEDRLADALALARRLNYLMQDELPNPEITQDPEGDFDFEWCLDSRTLVTVWNHDGHVSWAGLCDGHSSHGRSEGNDVPIPYPLRDLLRAVTAKMTAVAKSVQPQGAPQK